MKVPGEQGSHGCTPWLRGQNTGTQGLTGPQSDQGDAHRWRRTSDASTWGTARAESSMWRADGQTSRGESPTGGVPHHTPFSFPAHRGCIFTTDNTGRMSFFVILNPARKVKGEWGRCGKECVPACAWFLWLPPPQNPVGAAGQPHAAGGPAGKQGAPAASPSTATLSRVPRALRLPRRGAETPRLRELPQLGRKKAAGRPGSRPA